MAELTVVIVGCGYAGEQHARGFIQAQGARLLAVCDLNARRAQALAGKSGVRYYRELEEAIKVEQPDIVSIATDEYHHDEPALMALEAGAHVFCEKMIAHSLEAGQRMVQVARRHGLTLGINYNYRHVPAYQRIRRDIQEGLLHSPCLMVAHTHAFLWHHTLDLARFFLGEPSTVQATLVEDDELRRRTYPWKDHHNLLYVPSRVATATFHFSSNVIAAISASAHVPFDEHWLSFSIYSPRASVHINHAIGGQLIGSVGPGPLARELKTLPPFTVEDSFRASIQSFVTAVQAGRAPAATGEDGLAVMQMEAAVVRASSEQRLPLMEA